MPSLQFKGKSAVWNHHLAVPYHELIPRKEKSLSKKLSLHDNLIVHGDNLLALKALLPTYAGKVKCIYIDPPYNTGNEGWAYNDRANSPMLQEWLGKAVDREDLTRHDKWLCMMTPRLRLLRELLREDGVIFISIDDNEQHRLRQLMDEIFGEENFITNIIWQKKYSQSNDAKYFSDTHDFIMVYAKCASSERFKIGILQRTSEQNERYDNSDNDPRGSWMSQPLHAKSGKKDEKYSYTFKNGVKWSPPIGTYPRYSKSSLEKADKEGRIWFGKSGNSVPRMKKFLENMREGVIPRTLWLYSEVGSNDDAKRTLKEIFDDNPFDSPKPVSLLKRIFELSTDKDSIILDSFAGSGTTAHAVLALNKEDGGNRKFILVECENYADKITAERVRRVSKGVKNAKDENLRKGLGGTFSYFDLGKPIEMQSILEGRHLPSYLELARYVFYTATGEEFDERKMHEKKQYIGESKDYEVYLFYKPDVEYLKNTALTIDRARALGPFKKKKRLVFAPVKFLDEEMLEQYRIAFAQLPFEIYRLSS